MTIELSEGYKPNQKEDYMSPEHLEYFRQKLLAWRAELLQESENTISHLKEENWQEPDINDRASLETDAALELRTRDRYRKLVNKIDSALSRVADGSYGYCDDTGEEMVCEDCADLISRVKTGKSLRAIATFLLEIQLPLLHYLRVKTGKSLRAIETFFTFTSSFASTNVKN